MEKPKTMQGVLDALWYAVVGLNHDGLIDTVKNLRDDMLVLKAKSPLLWTRADHDKECAEEVVRDRQVQKETVAKKVTREVTVREWLMIVIAIGATVVSVLALVLRR